MGDESTKMGKHPEGLAQKKTDTLFGCPWFGGRYRTRTCDPLHVKQMLIPAELTVRILNYPVLQDEGYYTAFFSVCQCFFFRKNVLYSKKNKMHIKAWKSNKNRCILRTGGLE